MKQFLHTHRHTASLLVIVLASYPLAVFSLGVWRGLASIASNLLDLLASIASNLLDLLASIASNLQEIFFFQVPLFVAIPIIILATLSGICFIYFGFQSSKTSSVVSSR